MCLLVWTDKLRYILKLYTGLFHIFVVFFSGETGIGKSTLMDTLFNTHFDSTPSTHDLPGVKLKSHTYGKEINVHSSDNIVSAAVKLTYIKYFL